MKCLISGRLLPAVTVFISVGLCCCTSKTKQQQHNTVVDVRIATVTESDAMHTLNYVGTIEDESSVALSFPVIGNIEKVYVSEGQHVNKGQLLARLDPSSAQNLLDAAGSTLKQAQDAYDRLKSIHDNGSLPEIQMVEMETKLRQVQSTYNISKKNLDDCSLYAPINGVIGKKMAESGEYALVGKAVLTIMDISSVRVRISVPESEISAIPADCKSTITVTALAGKAFYGKGVEKNVMANPVSHSYPAYIKISNPKRELLPGMVCQVKINTDNESQAVVIPIGLVRNTAGGQKFVWGVENGRAKRMVIKTGVAKGNGVEVESGLSAGDSIVAEGYQKVSEGEKLNQK